MNESGIVRQGAHGYRGCAFASRSEDQNIDQLALGSDPYQFRANVGTVLLQPDDLRRPTGLTLGQRHFYGHPARVTPGQRGTAERTGESGETTGTADDYESGKFGAECSRHRVRAGDIESEDLRAIWTPHRHRRSCLGTRDGPARRYCRQDRIGPVCGGPADRIACHECDGGDEPDPPCRWSSRARRVLERVLSIGAVIGVFDNDQVVVTRAGHAAEHELRSRHSTTRVTSGPPLVLPINRLIGPSSRWPRTPTPRSSVLLTALAHRSDGKATAERGPFARSSAHKPRLPSCW
jgi:hypothetical protein